jgi:integrase
MLASGVHPAIASAVLGHSSPAFTMNVYQHVTDGMTERAAAVLGDALGLEP